MEKYTFIDNEEDLNKFLKYLYDNNITKIALDFEGEYNLHIYGEKLCLIQIFDGEKYYLIDPIKINDEGIKKLLGNGKIAKYMYDAGSDIAIVYKQYGVKLTNIYDQKILVDVLDNFESRGLDGIINSLFGINNANKAKFQQYPWYKRPIIQDKDALDYALNDVKYLFEINKILLERIAKDGKMNELIEAIISKQYDFDKERLPSFFKKPEYKKLSEEKKAKVTELFNIREEAAKELNVPPSNVIRNETLFDLINKKLDLQKIKFSQNVPAKYVSEITEKFEKIIASLL
jgi:ribonuclease D